MLRIPPALRGNQTFLWSGEHAIHWNSTLQNHVSPLSSTSNFLINAKRCHRYTTPQEKRTLKPGERTLNLVWYCNCAENALPDTLTDVDGHKHRYSLPTGEMRDEVWSKQRGPVAEKMLPPPFPELINKIQQPFVTVISHTTTPKASFFDGQVLLVGDALTPSRPRNALGRNQAAFGCLHLKRALQRQISLSECKIRVSQYAHLNRLRAISWGTRFQVGWLACFTSEIHFSFRVGASVVDESLERTRDLST